MTTTEKVKDSVSQVQAKETPADIAAAESLKEERKFARRARKVSEPGEQFENAPAEATAEAGSDESLKEERKFARRARKVSQPGEQFEDASAVI
jgi:hypothetical protein